jgi:hypothetical protein
MVPMVLVVVGVLAPVFSHCRQSFRSIDFRSPGSYSPFQFFQWGRTLTKPDTFIYRPHLTSKVQPVIATNPYLSGFVVSRDLSGCHGCGRGIAFGSAERQ